MKIQSIDFITRKMVRANPDVVFLFGDNVLRIGLGGQAGAMRDEPNTVGIATKFSPGMFALDFFSDRDFDICSKIILGDINRAVGLANRLSQTIALPENGLGTGLAELPERAPSLFAFLNSLIEQLETK